MHRSRLATMNMECFPTIPVGLILLGWPFSSSWRGEALSKEHPILGHFHFFMSSHSVASHFPEGPEEKSKAEIHRAALQQVCSSSSPEELEIANGAPKNTSSMFPEVALESGRDLRLNPEQANINKWHALVSSGSYTDNFEQCGSPLCLEPGEFM